MAERFGKNKPDPAIKKEVIRARQGARGVKRSQSVIVAGSMAATVIGWAVFTQLDNQVANSAQVAEPAAIVASVQQVIASPTPIVTSIQTSSASQAATQATPTPTTSTAQAVASTSAPVAAAVTRSSR